MTKPKRPNLIGLASLPDPNHKPIYEIAREVEAAWPNINPAALAYLVAMSNIDQIEDVYGVDSAQGIVLRFLANAQGWRGANAQRLKAELRDICKKCDERLAAKRHRAAYGVFE